MDFRPRIGYGNLSTPLRITGASEAIEVMPFTFVLRAGVVVAQADSSRFLVASLLGMTKIVILDGFAAEEID